MQKLRLVTIITEALLFNRLLEDLEDLELSGYSISDVRGKGDSGVDTSEWSSRNRKIELLISKDKEALIVDLLKQQYFDKYSVIFYASDVEVVRSDKFQ